MNSHNLRRRRRRGRAIAHEGGQRDVAEAVRRERDQVLGERALRRLAQQVRQVRVRVHLEEEEVKGQYQRSWHDENVKRIFFSE